MRKTRLSKNTILGAVLTLAAALSMSANATGKREKGVDPENAKVASVSKIQSFVCENTGLWCPN